MGENHCEEDGRNGSKNRPDVCRLCFGTADVSVHVGRQFDDGSTSIIEKIHYCTSLTVKVGDQFNQNICTTCAESLDKMYAFKSKAIACDLELSKDVYRDLTQFTYIQVSDDPLNLTYKLDLEEQDSQTDIADSCVYNIIDGDELTIEPVNITPKKKKTLKISVDEDDNIIFTSSVESDDNETQTSDINKLNGNSESGQESKPNCNKTNAAGDLKRSADKPVLDCNKKRPKQSLTDTDDEKPSLIIKNGKIVFICGICNFEAESMTLLQSHRARVHSDTGNYKCSECPTQYKTAGLLKRHTSIHHDFSHVCKQCDKRFSNKQGLDRHISSTHNNTPLEFKCVQCNTYFDTMDKMEDHLVVHYINPSNSFICNHCDRSFTTYAAKNKHIDLEHMVEIECNICHVILPTKEAMDKHNNSVHQPKKKENKTYACTTCGKYFSGIKDVLIHRETHLSTNNV